MRKFIVSKFIETSLYHPRKYCKFSLFLLRFQVEKTWTATKLSTQIVLCTNFLYNGVVSG